MTSCNVARFLPLAAKEFPRSPAVYSPGKQARPLTFAELEAASNQAVHAFQKQGISRGHRVIVLVRPGVELIVTAFALFKMAALPVVIDPGMGLSSFLGCVRQTKPDALVAVPAGILLSHALGTSFSSIPRGRRFCVSSGFMKKLGRFSPEAPVAETLPEEPSAVLFTSGSTGAPKGVCYTHGIFDAQLSAIRGQYRPAVGGVDLAFLPLFSLFNPAFGCQTVVPPVNPARPARVNPAQISVLINRLGVTSTFGSPAIWGRIVPWCIKRGVTFPTLERVLMAGAPVPPRLVESFYKVAPNAEFHTPYGATEVLPVASISGKEILRLTRPLTQKGHGTCVGKPISGMDVRIIPLHEGPLETLEGVEQLPAGKVGEVIVSGPTVTAAYFGLPEATRRAKIQDGSRLWHRMGDCGQFDNEGRLWFQGRYSERIQTASGAVFTDGPEGVFNTHPRVYRSALIGFPAAVPLQTPVVAIEPLPEAWPLSARQRAVFTAELLELGQTTALTADLKHFVFIRNFPVDVRHNAKINRLLLSKMLTRKGLPEGVISNPFPCSCP